MVSTRLRLAAATAILVALVACGKGGSSGAAGGTKADFIAAGNGLCRGLDDRMDRLFATFIPTLQQRAAAYSQAVAVGRQFLGRFRALHAPEGDQDVQDQSGAQYERAIGLLQQGVAAANGTDLNGSNAFFAQGFAAIARADRILGDYGMSDCARPQTTRVRSSLPASTVDAFSQAKKDYIAQAEAVCASGNARLRPLEAVAFGAGIPDLATWQTFLEHAIPIFREMVDGIRALEPPPDDQATIASMLAAYDQALGLANGAIDAAKANDLQTFDGAMQRVSQASRSGDRIAEAYGFDQCREAN